MKSGYDSPVFDFLEVIMKKISFLVFAIFLSFLFVSCGDADPKPATYGDENEVSDDEGAEDGDVRNDEENVTEPDETVVDEEIVTDDEPVEEPDETEEPDENQEPTNPGFDVIGTFNLSYSGPVHESVSMNDMTNLGGSGSVQFLYNDQPITFNEINIGIKLFPLAMMNNGIVVVWLDSFSIQEAMGTAQKQVFGINLPQNTEIGSGEMASANIYAFYGDMTVNVKGGQFDINCVRSVTNIGSYEITVNDGGNLTMTASGELLDPAAGAAYLPYPACQ